MRITNSTPITPDNVANQTTRPDNTTNQAAATASGSSASSSLALMAFSLVPSFELLNLDATLAQIPAVRQDVLAATIRRLASGALQSPAALDATANAILGE